MKLEQARWGIEQTRLAACSAEPIRTPGTIQPHGALLGIDRESRRIVVASENLESVLGVAPEFALDHVVADLVGEDRLPALRVAAEGANPVTFDMNGYRVDAIVHRNEGPLAFVEFEPTLTVTGDSASGVYAAAHRLAALQGSDDLVDAVTREFSAITGFDRVMVYDFHPDGHGEVVAETRADGMDPYLDLHFPASDIPAQARDLYLTKLSRAIVSTSRPSVGLLAVPGTVAADLDLSLAELRSVSPFHLQFMRNMGQASTVSFSLVYRGQLIGMITCAHNTERRLPFILRRSLEVLANQIALEIGSAREIAALRRHVEIDSLRSALVSKIVASDDLVAALLEGNLTVLDLVPADSAAICLSGIVFGTPGAPLAVLDELVGAAGGAILETNALSTIHPALAARIPDLAGVLFVPLEAPGDFIAFFRGEVTRTIDWLGDVSQQHEQEVLAPRASFSAWTQSVSGTSLPWNDLAQEAHDLARDIDGALLRRGESRLATLALHDPLTGLPNRRFLMTELDRTLGLGGDLSLLFVDLDGFKSVNDTRGHETGDRLLIEIGRRLTAHTRENDRVARLGGDEFVVICDGMTGADAHTLAERMVEAIRQPFDGQTVTASIGILRVSDDDSAVDVLQRADAAMYRAKEAGRNRVSA